MRYRIILLFFICLLLQPYAFSQKNAFQHVKVHIDSISKFDSKDSQTIETIISSIIAEDWNERETAFSIYYWIAKNLKYDASTMRTNDNRSISEVALSAFNDRKAICWGYACLFTYLCERVDLKSNVISGGARGDYFEYGNSILSDVDSRHAWNGVFIDGEWILIDVTFANSNEKTIDFYFDVDPRIFILTHFPDDPNWQLVDQKRDSIFFEQLPHFSSMFFIDGFGDAYPQTGKIEVNNDGVFEIRLSCPKKTHVKLALYDYRNKAWTVPTYTYHDYGEIVELEVTLDKKGNYLLRVDSVIDHEYIYKIHIGIIAFIVEY